MRRLVDGEGLTPSQIVILTMKDKDSMAAGHTSIAGHPLFHGALTPDARAVRVSSVWKFKGLEADVVFLIDSEKKNPELRKAWEYVGISRAKHRAYVIE